MKLSLIEWLLIIAIIIIVILIAVSPGRAEEVYTITFYSTGEEGGNGKWGNLNAMGRVLSYGDIACDPAIPFGTKFVIDYKVLGLPRPETSYFICRDRGSAIKGKKIDVFIPEKLGGVFRCFELGRRQMKVIRK